ncbi:universal stress protein [Paraglaciecola hydrolytica]|uniref:UspA domain-containing protein n=1 Tax=Paraglaciecola hydrolytica TaxID=1799789 RepID=A0A135ZYW6_9ALTE|nr:universal stress protein [Paraglaciecola hydrolytica]KXI28173.1 hypothetical protein AX660_17495 [Paraglaciecola hydrolytica]
MFKHAVVLIEDKHQNMAALKRALTCLGQELNKLTVYRQSKIEKSTSTQNRDEWQEQQSSAIRECFAGFNYDIELSIVFNLNGFDTQEFGRFLEANQCDVILKSNTEHKFLNGIFRGKTERYFVTDCPCPVWIVKPRLWDEDIEVLCCLDIDDKSEINHKLNVDILASGDQLARILSGQLHVIDCFFGEVCSMSFEVEKSGQFKRTTSVQGQHQELIQSYLAGLTLSEHSLHIVSGTPDFAIPDAAARLNAELVVIGNNADHGIMDRLFGDTAANLVSNMVCDVLVIKP